jgi:hypothetical protein
MNRKTVISAVIGSVFLTAAVPAAATWGWPWRPKPHHPHYPTNPNDPSPATQVPEPEMLGLFGLGSAGLIVARRKKRV